MCSSGPRWLQGSSGCGCGGQAGVCTAATESTPASELVTTQIHVVVGPHHSGRTAFCAKVLQVSGGRACVHVRRWLCYLVLVRGAAAAVATPDNCCAGLGVCVHPCRRRPTFPTASFALRPVTTARTRWWPTVVCLRWDPRHCHTTPNHTWLATRDSPPHVSRHTLPHHPPPSLSLPPFPLPHSLTHTRTHIHCLLGTFIEWAQRHGALAVPCPAASIPPLPLCL